MIVVEDMHRQFGAFRAVDGASLEIATGSITGLIGPNGAGKTTLFNVIAGRLPPTSGRVMMDGEDISGLAPHVLFGKGLLRTFQIAHEFSSMTVRENLMMVPAGQAGETLWNAWFRRSMVAAQERALRAKADEVLDFLTISHLADQKAGNISGGQKKLHGGRHREIGDKCRGRAACGLLEGERGESKRGHELRRILLVRLPAQPDRVGQHRHRPHSWFRSKRRQPHRSSAVLFRRRCQWHCAREV